MNTIDITITPRPYKDRIRHDEFQIEVTIDGNKVCSAIECYRESTDASTVLHLFKNMVTHDLCPIPSINKKPVTKEEFLAFEPEHLNS